MRTIIKIVTLCGLWLLSVQAFAFFSPQFEQVNSLGELNVLHSAALKQQRSVQIYLPPTYHQSDKQYPVLYVLDGQWHFTNAVAIQHALKVPSVLPEMIIVGIVNHKTKRRSMLGSQAQAFKQYLMQELIPFIDKKYRTSNERLIFGWEMGAFFASDIFFSKKMHFNGAILASGGEASKEAIEQFNQTHGASTKYLYIAGSQKDVYSIDHTEMLASNLSTFAKGNLSWKYQLFNDETHGSLPYVAMYQGLMHYYNNFASLSFASIEQYVELGGMDYLSRYFSQRGKRFGLATTVPESTKNHLIWLAWKNDNYQYFERFMTRFKDVLSTKRYDSSYWQNRFARFYLKHGNVATAQQFFERAVIKYPNQPTLYQGLGKVYLAQGQRDIAKEHFINALMLAKKTRPTMVAELEADILAL